VIEPGPAAGPAPAIRISSAVKRFGDITAVDDLSLDVPPGICLGLLGPNGAGKSTTMRLLTGQARPDSGAIEVFGIDLATGSKRARALMGVVPQQDNLDAELTVEQNLRVFATLYGVPRRDRSAAVERALGVAQLRDRRDTVADNLSGGMKRRLLIARGLVHRPRLVLLDEPTVGLDPQVRSDMWTLVDGLRSEGVTVLMSTHYIEEAQRLADDVALVSHGRVVARGAPADLVRAHVGARAVEYYGPPHRLSEVEELVRASGLPTRRAGPSVSVLRAEEAPPSLLDDLGDGGVRDTTLEDVFVLLTGESVE
jgi:lipooligosaccharide transport system ATP-binding protein